MTCKAMTLRIFCWQGIQFGVVVTEGRPDETGLAMARRAEYKPLIACGCISGL